MKSFVLALAAVIAASQTALADPQPLRTMIFNFTFGTSSDLEVLNSGIDPRGGAMGGTGVSDFTAADGDKGTITVDVLGERSDKSLVVRVSEQGQQRRRAGPAVCVVWATTAASCDRNLTVLPEELSIVRLLAPGFVDPSKIDENNHWTITVGDANNGAKMDFRVRSNDNGILKIDSDSSSSEHSGGSATSTTSEKISYDLTGNVPTAIDEYTIARMPQGMGQYQTQKTEVTASLSSDTLTKPH